MSAAFGGFAHLGMVNDLDLLQLWATGSNTNALSKSVDDIDNNQFQKWLAAIGLGRTLRVYDDALHTEFEDGFNDRLQRLIGAANEDLDDEDICE